MENMTPDQIPEQIPDPVPTTPERRRRQPPPKFALTLPAFLPRIGKDVRWYYDVRLWLPVVLVLMILAACAGNSSGVRSTQEEYKAIIAKMEEQAQAVQELPQPEVTEPAVPPMDPEAEALAILADSVGAGRSDNVKTIIMWVAINRSENAIEGHGKPLLEEIAMPHQWQGYDPEVGYTQATYDIALEVLEIRDNGSLRPLDRDMMWLVLNNDGSVTVRNKFQGQNWHEKTVK